MAPDAKSRLLVVAGQRNVESEPDPGVADIVRQYAPEDHINVFG